MVSIAPGSRLSESAVRVFERDCYMSVSKRTRVGLRPESTEGGIRKIQEQVDRLLLQCAAKTARNVRD